jgi:predicted GTPase
MTIKEPKKVIIMGAAGRDFHNFNLIFRDNPEFQVIGFTATQIPNISNRIYPSSMAGSLYPNGIPIYPETKLDFLIKKHNIDYVVFSYSDVSNQYVMERASEVIALGANFMFLGANKTMLSSSKPVISVCAIRTGCGKSQTTRKIASILCSYGQRVVVVRHPMAYGELELQRIQRFETLEDLKIHQCTIEEREEYEPLINEGIIIYAGVDYQAILRQAEKEADIIIWDGGNNDLPFFQPSLEVVVTDPHRPGHELTYFPGTVNLKRADIIIINKIDTAEKQNIDIVRKNIQKINQKAIIIEANSPFEVQQPSIIQGKEVLVIEDGPTLTHGEMKYGVATLAAKKYQAKTIIDPRPFAIGTIKQIFDTYPWLGNVLPAMGYSKDQISELEETIKKAKCDLIIAGTPINIKRFMKIEKPCLHVTYRLEENTKPNLQEILCRFKK